MAAPAKRVRSGQDTPHSRSARGAAAHEVKPFIRVRHSVALHRRTVAVLGALEQAEDPTTHRDALAELILELTSGALDYCFMKPLKLTKPGYIVEQTASLGLAGVRQIVNPIVRQIIGHMDGRQLLSVSGSMRQFMR